MENYWLQKKQERRRDKCVRLTAEANEGLKWARNASSVKKLRDEIAEFVQQEFEFMRQECQEKACRRTEA